MLSSWKMLFRKTRPVQPPATRVRLRVESLEARELLNAAPGLFAGHALVSSIPFHQGHTASIQVDYADHLSGSHEHGETHVLTATLTGTTGSGQVKFTSTATAGQNTFTASVTGLTANTTYDVNVTDSTGTTTTIGMITTDGTGAGSLSVSNVTSIIAAGETVTIADTTNNNATVLSGRLARGEDCHEGHPLSTNLTGATGSGTATFLARQNTLNVSVTGLTAGAAYTVQVVNGTGAPTTVGTINTDANGAGKVSITNPAAAVAAGSTINVVDSTGATVLTGTLTSGKPVHLTRPLVASLTGTAGSGKAIFRADANSLKVSVTGLAATTAYAVQLMNGTGTPTPLGTITTDGTGAGTLSVSNLAATIAAGSTINVVGPDGTTIALTGTFATGGHHHHGDD